MAVKKTFDFKLNDAVKLTSGEIGTVIARSHSIEANPQYFVRYVGADGAMKENWWAESVLAAA